MQFSLEFTERSEQDIANLEVNDPKKYRKVRKTLGFMEANIKHPALETHEYSSLKGPKGEKVFEAYVENNTPAAYRVFWYYGPDRGVITILAVTPHP